MLLKRSLRNGSASVDHSLNHKAPEDRLIRAETWTRECGRMIHELNVPASSQSYLGKLEAALVAGLAALDEAVGAGVLEIEDGRVVSRPKAQTEDPKLMDGRRALFGNLGSVQLPSVLVEVERVAVDTQGFTHFAMALAKLVGFDLCPRLVRLKDRKLYLPRGLSIPDRLPPIARETVSRRVITKGWDPLLRIAASVKSGWVSATYVIDRFASASRGDVAADAGDALGKLLRTLNLCDYLGNPSFRTEILNLLNQGESVHSLERAIHNGSIGAKRGRTTEQMAAISGALSLIANVVMAWNTQHI
jgi:hypothetical protein